MSEEVVHGIFPLIKLRFGLRKDLTVTSWRRNWPMVAERSHSHAHVIQKNYTGETDMVAVISFLPGTSTAEGNVFHSVSTSNVCGSSFCNF